jgi:hypothetical protein
MQDKTSKVIEHYLSTVSTESLGPNSLIDLSKQNRDGTGDVVFESISYSSDDSSLAFHPYADGPLEIIVNLLAKSSRTVGSVAIVIFDRYGTKLINADTLSYRKTIRLKEGKNKIIFRINQLHLNPGMYTIGLWVADPPSEVYDYISSAAIIEVVETEKERFRIKADGLVPVTFQISDTL